MDKNLKNNEIPDSVRKKLDYTYENILSSQIDTNTNIKTHSKSKFIGIITVAASLAVITIIGIYNPTLAEKIPIIGNVFKELNDSIRTNKLVIDKFNDIGVSSTIDNLTISIDETLYDGNRLFTSFIVKSKKPFNKTNFINAFDDYADGSKSFNLYLTDFSINNKNAPSYSYSMPSGKFLDDYTFICSTTFELDPTLKHTTDEINIDMKFNILHYSELDSKGDSIVLGEGWNLNYNVKPNNDNILRMDVTSSKEGITINRVIYTPLSLTLDLSLPKKYIEMNSIESDEDEAYFYRVIDNNGRELGELGSSGNYLDDTKNSSMPRYAIKYNLDGSKVDFITIEFYKYENKKSTKVTDFKINLTK